MSKEIVEMLEKWVANKLLPNGDSFIQRSYNPSNDNRRIELIWIICYNRDGMEKALPVSAICNCSINDIYDTIYQYEKGILYSKVFKAING